jgi:GTP cyclohydrolase I
MVQPCSSGTGTGATPAPPARLRRMQACVHSLLGSIQEDPSRQGLLDTPKVRCSGMVASTPHNSSTTRERATLA